MAPHDVTKLFAKAAHSDGFGNLLLSDPEVAIQNFGPGKLDLSAAERNFFLTAKANTLKELAQKALDEGFGEKGADRFVSRGKEF